MNVLNYIYFSVRLGDFVPAQHLSHVRSFQLFGLSVMECKAGLEKEVFQRYKDYSIQFQNQYLRKIAYLEFLRSTPFYGAAFFNGRTDRRTNAMSIFELGKRFLTGYTPSAKMNVRIGIQSRYITVVDPVKHEVLLTQKIEDCTWLSNVKEETNDIGTDFFLHFPDPEAVTRPSSPIQSAAPNTDATDAPQSKILQIETNQTCMMVALLNSLDEIAVSTLGSAHDLHMDQHAVISDSEKSDLEIDYCPNTTVTVCLLTFLNFFNN